MSKIRYCFVKHIILFFFDLVLLLPPSNFGLKTAPANKFDKGDQACSIGLYAEYLAAYVDAKRRSKFSSWNLERVWSKIKCLLRLKVNNLGHYQIGLCMQLFSLPLKCCANHLHLSQWLMDGTWLLAGANLQDQYVVLVNEPIQCCEKLWYLMVMVIR